MFMPLLKIQIKLNYLKDPARRGQPLLLAPSPAVKSMKCRTGLALSHGYVLNLRGSLVDFGTL
jgi:hypothetical protein